MSKTNTAKRTEQIKWIDAGVELPDADSEVLVCYQRNDSYDREVTIAFYDDSLADEGESSWAVNGAVMQFGTVLFWAELPEGPKRS